MRVGFLLALCGLLSACGTTSAPSGPQTVWTVSVKASATQAIPRAIVSVNGTRIGETDADGHVPVILPYQTPVTVSASARGYQTLTSTATATFAGGTWTIFLAKPR